MTKLLKFNSVFFRKASLKNAFDGLFLKKNKKKLDKINFCHTFVDHNTFLVDKFLSYESNKRRDRKTGHLK